MSVRTASMAGRFYPRNRFDLADMIRYFQKAEKKNINFKLPISLIIGGIVPHAGYEYSGYEAIHFFELLRKSKQKFDTVVIIMPNHTGYGTEISLDINEFWETPLGMVEIDHDFQYYLDFDISTEAHKNEHSGEVMIPFLQQSLSYPFRIIPIIIKDQTITVARKIAASLYEVSMKLNRKILVIASSDFSHFVSPEEGISQDDFAIAEILKFNTEELLNVVVKKRISICGCAPIMTLLEYSLIYSNNTNIELLQRGNSSKRYPSMEVVDYISFLIYE